MTTASSPRPSRRSSRRTAASRWRRPRATGEHKPDVILMDISMPVMDGIEAVEELRRRGLESGVLMLTGSNARSDVDRARRAGAAGYMNKEQLTARREVRR